MAFLLNTNVDFGYNNNIVNKLSNFNRLLKSRMVHPTENISFQKPLHILLVEDSQVDRRMLESLISESPRLTASLKSTNTLKDALKILHEKHFDVVLLDLNLPDSAGEQSIVTIARHFPEIAIVVNTGAYEDDLGIQTLALGVQDFLVKGKYNGYILNKVLHYAVERKRLEMELRKATNKLDSTQAQLVQAEKMKVVGTLASGVAHEVKNPLATILYGVTYLSEHVKFDDDKVKIVLENIKDATMRANEIITDMLDFSSLHKLNIKKEDFNAVIFKSISLVKHQLDKHHVSVIAHPDESLPLVDIDKNRIEQVLVNLMLNSVFAMAKGGTIEIRVKCVKLSSDLNELPDSSKKNFHPQESVIILSIEDNGSGIPEDKLAHIFEPFFTTRRARGGVGLGLSVVQNIVETHKGAIAIENRSAGGVKATLVLRA